MRLSCSILRATQSCSRIVEPGSRSWGVGGRTFVKQDAASTVPFTSLGPHDPGFVGDEGLSSEAGLPGCMQWGVHRTPPRPVPSLRSFHSTPSLFQA